METNKNEAKAIKPASDNVNWQPLPIYKGERIPHRTSDIWILLGNGKVYSYFDNWEKERQMVVAWMPKTEPTPEAERITPEALERERENIQRIIADEIFMATGKNSGICDTIAEGILSALKQEGYGVCQLINGKE